MTRNLPPEDIASKASLSMILEAAAYPKPGNVHRLNDFSDTSFEHFLASASAVQNVFLKSVSSTQNNGGFKDGFEFGSLFYEAVLKNKTAQNGGNTHFGTLLLLIPLAAAAGHVFEFSDSEKEEKEKDTTGSAARKIGKEITGKAAEICRQTTFEDAACFYEAFNLLSVPVQKPKKSGNDYDLDLTNPAAVEKIKLEKIPLFDLMAMGASRDMVAAEWVNGFEKSRIFAEKLQKNKAWFEENPKKGFGSVINSAVIYTFLDFMSNYPDTFILTKFDERTALKTQLKAADVRREILGSKNLKKEIHHLQKFDQKLQKRKINPGSLADIAAAGIFIALLEGLEF